MRKIKITFQEKTTSADYKKSYVDIFSTFAEYSELSAKAKADSNLNQKLDVTTVRFIVRYFSKVRDIESTNFISSHLGLFKIISRGRQLDLRGTKFEFLAVRVNNG